MMAQAKIDPKDEKRARFLGLGDFSIGFTKFGGGHHHQHQFGSYQSNQDYH
jgi:hypothetical protein